MSVFFRPVPMSAYWGQSGRDLLVLSSGEFDPKATYRRAETFSFNSYRFINGFATCRALSIKSLVTGLSVRFFKVMIPTGGS